jgi:hypothetical protein
MLFALSLILIDSESLKEEAYPYIINRVQGSPYILSLSLLLIREERSFVLLRRNNKTEEVKGERSCCI